MPFAVDGEKSQQQSRRRPKRRLTELDVLDRIDRLREALNPPLEFWSVLLEILVPDEMGEPPIPDVPTMAVPGSLDKLLVMAARVDRGESPFHPDDLWWESAEGDRLFQVARNHPNGEVDRRHQPVYRQTGAGIAQLPRPGNKNQRAELPEALKPYAVPPASPPPPRLDDSTPPTTASRDEGFLLRAEAVLVTGKIRPEPRRRKAPRPCPYTQLLLWDEDALKQSETCCIAG